MMHMKRYLVLVILLIAGVMSTRAQVQERFKTQSRDSTGQKAQSEISTPQPKADQKEDFWDRVVIGGNASLSFGTYTFIYIAPSLGYKFTDNFVAGPGFIYQYARIGEIRQNGQTIYESYETSVYGPKAFANFIILDRFYTGGQFEYLNHDVALVNPNTLAIVGYDNIWTPVLFAEVGMMSTIGSKGFAQIGLRYNLLHDQNSPYGTAFFPVIGIFF